MSQPARFQRLLDGGLVNSRAQIARRYSVSRARATQVLNIVRLPRPAIDVLVELRRQSGSHCTERQLRPILRLPTEEAQLAAVQGLRERVSEG